MRVALCCPGQGSQAAGMADGLLDHPMAQSLLAAAAAEGLDLRAVLDGDEEALRPTEVAQPALLLVAVTLAATLPSGVEVVGVAGHSVGEYAALVAAGALEPGDAMRLVVARGRAMAAMREGAMVALLGADMVAASDLCAAVTALGLGPLVIANLNAPGQVVLSGTTAAVAAAVDLARDRGVRKAMPLRVSGAFHSPLMADAAAAVATLIDAADIADPRVPVACNVDGRLVIDSAGLRDRLKGQLVSPVRWTDCVEALASLEPEVFVELGPGGVLSALARRIVPGARTVAVATTTAAAGLADVVSARG